MVPFITQGFVLSELDDFDLLPSIDRRRSLRISHYANDNLVLWKCVSTIPPRFSSTPCCCKSRTFSNVTWALCSVRCCTQIRSSALGALFLFSIYIVCSSL